MFLTSSQEAAVREAACSNHIEGHPEVLVTQAIEAVLYGRADAAAYEVAGAAGVAFECGGNIWWRRENPLDATKAREIITQAKSDEMHDGPVPEKDDEAVSVAEGLVKLAED